MPAGSAEIEKIFLDYFAAQGLQTAPTAFDGRSDYRAFIQNGIPAGGLFTGAEAAQDRGAGRELRRRRGRAVRPVLPRVLRHAGDAHGRPAGDRAAQPATAASMGGIGFVGLDQMSDAAAHATITLAQSTAMLNGERAKGNFNTDEKIAEQAAR